MSAALEPTIVGLQSAHDAGAPEDPCVASRRTRITRDLAQVVVVAVANGTAQGPHDLNDIVVGSLDVHRLAFETEGDISVSFPGTEMACASGEVRVRLEAELARICDRAEHHMPRQVDRHGQRRLIVRPEVPVRESWPTAIHQFVAMRLVRVLAGA